MKAARASSTPALTCCLAIAALATAFGGVDARAEGIDPALPAVITIGPPPGVAAVDRLDLARTGRSQTALPAEPTEIWRRAIGSIPHAPVVHADGGLTVTLSSPEIVHIDAAGNETWRARLGSAVAARAPVVTSDGSVAVLTTAPLVAFVSPKGKVVGSVALPRAAFGVQSAGGGGGQQFESFVTIAPTRDGAVVVAAARTAQELDASGRVRWSMELPERIATDLVAHVDGWLFASESGSVYQIHPPGAPRRLGTFRTPVQNPIALADERTLVAQAGGNRVVSLDLRSGAAFGRVADTAFVGFDAPFALDVSGRTWQTTFDGFLVAHDAAGAEVARTAVDRGAQQPRGAALTQPGGIAMGLGGVGAYPAIPQPQPFNMARPPGVVIDPSGRVAFLRSGGRLGVRSPEGSVGIGTERACSNTVGLVPAGPERLLVACREGTLIMFGSAEAAAKAE